MRIKEVEITHPHLTQIQEELSEVPCLVSSDPHERLNDLATVLRIDPAKLQWL